MRRRVKTTDERAADPRNPRPVWGPRWNVVPDTDFRCGSSRSREYQDRERSHADGEQASHRRQNGNREKDDPHRDDSTESA